FAVAGAATAGTLDLPFRLQPPDRFFGFSPNGEGPHQLLLGPVPRHGHAEGIAVSPGIKERRLPTIRAARFDDVVRPDGNGRLLDIIPVQVPEAHREAAVGVPRPPLEDG